MKIKWMVWLKLATHPAPDTSGDAVDERTLLWNIRARFQHPNRCGGLCPPDCPLMVKAGLATEGKGEKASGGKVCHLGSW